MISYSDFSKLELKTARILSAEKVEGADKLFKLSVDLGDEKRQLVAGIADTYTSEQLEGKTVIVLTNLEPRTIRGVESQGMLLAADGDEIALLCPDKEIPAGTRVR